MTRRLVLSFLLTILLTSTAAAQEERVAFRTVPWAAWASAGTDFDSWSLSVGIRRGPFGLGAGYRNITSTEIPAYSTDAPPATGEEKSFPMTSVGLDLYTMQPFADFLNLYATIGGYADINTILVRDQTSLQWYRSEKSPDWTNARVAYGAGLEIVPVEPLLLGLGYHSVRGFNLHLGISW
jgi:opacity protein-like surface antigen